MQAAGDALKTSGNFGKRVPSPAHPSAPRTAGDSRFMANSDTVSLWDLRRCLHTTGTRAQKQADEAAPIHATAHARLSLTEGFQECFIHFQMKFLFFFFLLEFDLKYLFPSTQDHSELTCECPKQTEKESKYCPQKAKTGQKHQKKITDGILSDVLGKITVLLSETCI